MCGIFGFVDKKSRLNESSKAEIGVQMASILSYRGPDNQGLYFSGNSLIGHVRLSIIDLSSAGSQPMSDTNNRFQIVFNGEIFNYIELREELKERYTFVTNTDTEVLLAAYIVWGQSCLEKLNGMFAFAILDVENETIFIARDRFGIKPFYYYNDDDFLVFASEITPILGFKKNWEVNSKAVVNYLLLNRVAYDEETFFSNVFRLKPSHAMLIENSKFSIFRWYELSKTKAKGFEKNEDFYELLRESLKFTLRSDVPVGITLSGGLDSGSILSTIIYEDYLDSINTYSAVYDEKGSFNEFGNIQAYSSKILEKHYTYPNLNEYLTIFDNYIKCYVEPTPDMSTFAQFCVFGSVNGKNKVLLDGQGADESLGGYIYFFGLYFKELLYRFQWLMLIKELAHYLLFRRSNEALKYFLFYLIPPPVKLWFIKNNLKFIKSRWISYLHPRVIKDLYGANSLSAGSLAHFEHKFEHQLIWGDRSSMWYSIEVRFPFLDHRLVERLIRTKPSKLLKNGITKVLLRDVMNGILPNQIRLDKRKIGYETPGEQWVRKPEYILYFKSIIENNRFIEEYADTRALIKKVENGHLKEKDVSKFLHLARWKQLFIDDNPFYFFTRIS